MDAVSAGITEVIGRALQLRPDAFGDLHGELHSGGSAARMGIWIALLAGLSQAIGQAFVLFVNRVQPLRFAISLVIEALLFVSGFLVWASSTWLVAWLVFGSLEALPALIGALGIAHAPQLFAFFGALPYLGGPILTLLSLWTAIAFVVGVASVADLSPWSAFGSLVVGWLVMYGLQRTAGQPVMALGRWSLDRAAGVPLIRDSRRLESLLQAGALSKREWRR
jgi:hypothetical protein